MGDIERQTHGHPFTLTEPWTTIRCCKCCLLFAVPKGFEQNRLGDGRKFYCPNGHEQVYTEAYERRQREKDREDNPDYERQQERMQALHRAEQAEAKIADLQARLSGACEVATELVRQQVVRESEASGKLPEASPPAAKETPPSRRTRHGLFDKRRKCPKCGKLYKAAAPYWAHLRHVHGLDPNEVQDVSDADAS